MRVIALILCVVLGLALAGCGGVSEKMISDLGPVRGCELRVWSMNHGTVWDLTLHSLKTCPFLNYTPNWLFHNQDSVAWAEYCRWFYEGKHDENLALRTFLGLKTCDCDARLADQPKWGVSVVEDLK